MREIIAPLSQLLKSGEISSVELTNKYINAIENDNPKYMLMFQQHLKRHWKMQNLQINSLPKVNQALLQVFL